MEEYLEGKNSIKVAFLSGQLLQGRYSLGKIYNGKVSSKLIGVVCVRKIGSPSTIYRYIALWPENFGH